MLSHRDRQILKGVLGKGLEVREKRAKVRGGGDIGTGFEE